MRRRYFWIIPALMFFLAGCLQSQEHLVVQKNGSGTLETHIVVPQGTIQLLDQTLGSMMKAMTAQLSPDQKAKPSESIAEQMFGSKDDILKKAAKTGVQVEFLSWDRQKLDDGLHVDYKLKFDDVGKLLSSGIVGTKINLVNKGSGIWVCTTPEDQRKVEESKEKAKQFEQFRNSDQFNQMDGVMKKMMESAMSNLKLEFQITLPYPIVAISGFEKVDNHTARLAISADLMTDPQAMEKIYQNMGGNKIVWNATGQPVSDDVIAAVPAAAAPSLSQREAPDKTVAGMHFAKGTAVKARLRNGMVYEGTVVEQTDNSIQIVAFDVPVTLYKDELESLEPSAK